MNERQLKFRAWDSTDSRWIEDFQISPAGEILLYTQIGYDEMGYEAFSPTDEGITIQQYTGLKDRNGVEIYEGDILGEWREEQQEVSTVEPCAVVWSPMSGGFWLVFEDPQQTGPMVRDGDAYEFTTGKWAVVIGNIHETPDLLK